ncbi:uncharacterized protein DFL_008725 [Arthrobotrys flagrans]|uniref:Uncharacterized protein n=1 Tax=Arthrobotrys flagrans TaxID=97331 RepID=A0A436ZPL6_ARTFL|nr:hypothetical protein DFL_008725 [Arthrobotrys flagrans]
MHPLLLAVLSALASQALAGPLDTGILLSRDALAEIPEYNVSKRHDPFHHEEIGITGRDLLNHLHENYSHRNFIREIKSTPDNKTFTAYEIPDDLMDIAIRSFPLRKRHANIVKMKKRALAKRSEPILFGPQDRRDLGKRSGTEGLSNFKYESYCEGGKKVTNDVYLSAMNFFCLQHNDYLRDFLSSGGAQPPSYCRAGPYPLADGGEGDFVFHYAKDEAFPWYNMAYTCKQLTQLVDCAQEGFTTGGTIHTISKVGNGNVRYAINPGDTSSGQPFDSG